MSPPRVLTTGVGPKLKAEEAVLLTLPKAEEPNPEGAVVVTAKGLAAKDTGVPGFVPKRLPFVVEAPDDGWPKTLLVIPLVGGWPKENFGSSAIVESLDAKTMQSV